MDTDRRLLIHLDMNAFFASVEQQDNPRLRGRPVAVGGRPGTRSIVAAASYEAKRLGVKTAMSTAEALAVCPSLLLVPGRNERYRAVAAAVVETVIRYTPDVEVFSIDECFADLTAATRRLAPASAAWERRLQAAVNLITAIKGDIRRRVGDYLDCSVGLAPNKFLAKLASDRLKPNGLVVVTPTGRERLTAPATGWQRTRLVVTSVDRLILSSQLTDFCGLGRRLACHLRRLGITTPAQLRMADPAWLEGIFGVVGRRLWEWSWGQDDRPLAVHYRAQPEQSLSHAVTLPAARFTPRDADLFLARLAAKLGRRLRRRRLVGRRVSAFIRYADFTGWGGHRTFPCYLADDAALYHTARAILARHPSFRPVRLVGIGIGLLAPAAQQTRPLLLDDQRTERLTAALDLTRDRFGERALERASVMVTRGRHTEATHAFGFNSQETD